MRQHVHRPGGAPQASLRAAVVGCVVQVTVAGADGQHRHGNAVAKRDAGGLGRAVGDLGQAGAQGRSERTALGRVELVEHAVGGLGGGGIGRDRTSHRALHQEGGGALDGGQAVVDGDALDSQHAGGHGRGGGVALDRLQRGGDPVQHRIGLRLGRAGERAGDGLAVAGGVGDGQADAVVALAQVHAGQLEHAGGAGGGVGSLAGQSYRGTRIRRAAQGDDGRTGLVVGAFQCVGAGDAKGRTAGGLGVEREADVNGWAGVARRVLGLEAYGVCAIGQAAAGQGGELGGADHEAAVGLHAGHEVGVSWRGARGGAGVECCQQLADADVVAHLASKGRAVGDAVGGGPARVGLQRGR